MGGLWLLKLTDAVERSRSMSETSAQWPSMGAGNNHAEASATHSRAQSPVQTCSGGHGQCA
jgi:hypothetical protein